MRLPRAASRQPVMLSILASLAIQPACAALTANSPVYAADIE